MAEEQLIDNYFFQKFNFAANYFNTLLNLSLDGKRKFPQALIFEGSDTINQYLFALELARILNCTQDSKKDCDCINCKWIKSHTHPCVNNVSEIHFKGENDETKTVISAKQAKAIEKNLTLSSDYHRFFIFFSSKDKPMEEKYKSAFEFLNYDSDINFEINPLEFSTFHPTAPNALLKSIEEPPEKTTFVFLTNSKENIISTIVSRCLVFKLSGEAKNEINQNILNLFSSYLNLNYQNCLDTADSVLAFSKENEINLVEILNSFIFYLLNLAKSNINNLALYQKIQNDIKLVNYAIKQSNALVSDRIVLEALMLKIVRGY